MRSPFVPWLLIVGCTLAFLFAVIPMARDAAAQEPQEKMTPFPEHGVEVPTPAGFAPATEWKGLSSPEGASVMVNTLPAPLKELASGFTAEGLLKGGMTLVERIDGTPGDKNAVAVFVTQTQQGVEFEKWIAVLGDARATTMVVVTYPRDLADKFAEECKVMALNSRLLAGGMANRPPEQVDFELGKPKLLKLATTMNQAQIFTADGTMPAKSPSDPLLITAKSFGRLPVADIADFAEMRVKQTAETEILEIESIQPNTSDPQLQTCELIAQGKHQESGVPLVVYQKVLAAPDCYYLIVGMVGADRRDEMLPEFQRIAAGFKRLQAARPGRERATTSMAELRRREMTPEQAEEMEKHIEESRREAQRRMDGRESRRLGSGRRPGDDESRGPFAIVDFEDDRPKEDREMRRPAWEREESNNSQDRPQPSRLGRPKKPLPVLKYDKTAVKTSPMLGGDGEELFDELAPEGGLLVGARVVVGDSFGGSVQAIEPIFQVGGKYVRSTLHGQEGDDGQLLLAPPGHAVGGVQVGAGLLMDAMRLVYLPIDGNRLDVRDRTYSEWVGGDGGGTTECVSDGSFVVGLGGTYEREEMKSLRLAYVDRDDVELAGAAAEKSNDKAIAKTKSAAKTNEMRRWTSADGKFSITGRLENFDGKTATIIKGDGKRVKAPAEKLSPKDQGYLEAMAPK
jgi:hypothetical protein